MNHIEEFKSHDYIEQIKELYTINVEKMGTVYYYIKPDTQTQSALTLLNCEMSKCNIKQKNDKITTIESLKMLYNFIETEFNKNLIFEKYHNFGAFIAVINNRDTKNKKIHCILPPELLTLENCYSNCTDIPIDYFLINEKTNSDSIIYIAIESEKVEIAKKQNEIVELIKSTKYEETEEHSEGGSSAPRFSRNVDNIINEESEDCIEEIIDILNGENYTEIVIGGNGEVFDAVSEFFINEKNTTILLCEFEDKCDIQNTLIKTHYEKSIEKKDQTTDVLIMQKLNEELVIFGDKCFDFIKTYPKLCETLLIDTKNDTYDEYIFDNDICKIIITKNKKFSYKKINCNTAATQIVKLNGVILLTTKNSKDNVTEFM